jgi:hypothetical protein
VFLGGFAHLGVDPLHADPCVHRGKDQHVEDGGGSEPAQGHHRHRRLDLVTGPVKVLIVGSTPGPVHHHADADQGDERPGDIGTVGTVTVDTPTPEEGQHDEEPAVHGVDASEVARLESRDDAVKD